MKGEGLKPPMVNLTPIDRTSSLDDEERLRRGVAGLFGSSAGLTDAERRRRALVVVAKRLAETALADVVDSMNLSDLVETDEEDDLVRDMIRKATVKVS